MRKPIILLFVLISVLTGVLCGQTPLAKERVIEIDGKQYRLTSKLKSLINLDFAFGYHHYDGKPLITETLEKLAQQEGWDYQHITDHTQVTPELLAPHQVAVGNSISAFNNGDFSDSSENAVQQFVENGGGFFSVHGTGDGEGDEWPWYDEVFYPVDYQGHAQRTNCPIYRYETAREHVVLEGLEALDKSELFGEWYRLGSDISSSYPDAEILFETFKDDCPGAYSLHDIEYSQERIWIIPIGQGRHLFFPFGHDSLEAASFPDNTWDQFFLQGLYYVAGYDTVYIDPILGCIDPAADNTTADATKDDGTCIYTGCANMDAENYFCKANKDAFPCVGSYSYTTEDISDDESCGISINRRKFGNPSISVRQMVVFAPDHHIIQIANTEGAIIFSQNANDAKNYDLSEFQPGLYFIKVVTPGISETQKMLIY